MSEPNINLGGPFRGLMTATVPENVPDDYARATRNMTVAEGYLRPRPGTIRSGNWTYETGGDIVAAFHWDTDSSVLERLLMLLKTDRGQLLGDPGQSAVPIELGPPGTLNPSTQACFLPVNRRLYIVDGSDRLVVTDGTPEGTIVAGLNPPREPDLDVKTGTLEESLDSRYTYAFSLYDADRDVESNAVFVEREYDFLDDPGKRLRIDFKRLNDRHPRERFTHYRVYRRDLERGDIAHWLILQPTTDTERIFDERTSAEYEEGRTRTGQSFTSLGNHAFGPYAPTRNHLPPAGRVAAVYQDRLFIANPDDGSQLYYSAIGRPDHFHPDDYISVAGDRNDWISGLVVMAGQLVIIKRTGFWVLSGAIVGMTNAIAALGGATPASYHNLVPTSVAVGGVQQSGQGAIVAGQDERLFYPGADGFRMWSGLGSRNITNAIKEDWERFVRAGQVDGRAIPQRLSFAYDARSDRLLVCNGGSLDGSPSLYVYHVGLDAWHPWVLATGERVTCVANTLASHANELSYDYRAALVAVSTPDRNGRPMWFDDSQDGDDAFYVGGDRLPFDFYWVSGRLLLRSHRKKHVWSAVWHHAAADDVRVVLGFAMDAEDWETGRPLEEKLLGSRCRRIQRVARDGNRLTFVIRAAPGEARQRSIGIQALGLWTEPIGRI